MQIFKGKILEVSALLGTSIECSATTAFFNSSKEEHWGFSEVRPEIKWGGLKGEIAWSFLDGKLADKDTFVLVKDVPLWP